MHVPRLVVAGPHSGSGKTTVSLALMRLFSRGGLDVRPFKVGPDYIDPAFHRVAAGTAGTNLDAWLMPEDQLKALFFERAPVHGPAPGQTPGRTPGMPPGLALIEGVMGLYDGLGASARCSTAQVAALLGAPVVLVINAGGVALSAAALVAGFAAFRPSGVDGPSAPLAGVIINRASGSAHYDLLRRCIEDNTGIPCIGWLDKNAVPALPERHLGLVQADEHHGLASYLDRLADAAEPTLDLDAILAVAQAAGPLVVHGKSAEPIDDPGKPLGPRLNHGIPAGPHPNRNNSAGAPGAPRNPVGTATTDPVRPCVGVARDAAFSFYYQDNLDTLERLGAELVFFSPLADTALPPALDGVYLGGGYPELFAEALEANAPFRAELKAALESGLPAFAECGGMLYLCASLTTRPEADSPRRHAMVGFFPQQAEMSPRLQPFGYVTVTLERDCLLGPAGTTFPAHEFHYSRLIAAESGGSTPCLRVEKPDGRHWSGGLARENVLAMYPHVHFRGCPGAAEHFIAACKDKAGRKGVQ